jgi:monoamine oxidase
LASIAELCGFGAQTRLNRTGQVVSENGPVKVTFDLSPEGGTPRIMMASSATTRRGYGSSAPPPTGVTPCFGSSPTASGMRPSSREVVEFNWSTEVWNRGCPVAVLAPGTLIDFGAALREPVDPIHWTGTETSTYWNGYMDGAVRSGTRAAAEVLGGL